MSKPDDFPIEVTAPAKPEYASLLRLMAGSLAQVAGFSDEEAADLRIAVSEAATNAIIHAYRDGPEEHKEFRTSFLVSPGGIEVEVTDCGGAEMLDGKSPKEVRDVIESGLGLSIVEAIADEMTMEQEESGRCVLRFRKSRSAPET